MKTLHFSDHLTQVFAEEGKYDDFKELQFAIVNDGVVCETTEDGSERTLSKKEMQDKFRKMNYEILGLDEESAKSKKARKRALQKHGMEWFEILEEDIDFKVETGFHENEWFNALVDERNLALGDENEFYTIQDIILSVAKVSGDHHDVTMQKLNEGSSYRVETSNYAIKVGADIDRYIAGQVDWTKLTDKAAQAFVVEIQKEFANEVYAAAAALPNQSMFNISGALGTTTKDNFDELISNVETANGTGVYIVGTKKALKKLNGLADVDWADDASKAEYMALGRLGSYESTRLVEIPNRFEYNDVTAPKLFRDDKLFIFPEVEDKFIKFVNVGETEIVEINDKAEVRDDFMSLEIQREMGIGVQLGRYFGCWTITA